MMTSPDVAALTTRCEQLMSELDRTIDALAALSMRPVQSPACPLVQSTGGSARYRVTFVWKSAGVQSSIIIHWKDNTIDSSVPTGFTVRNNRYGSLTVTWKDNAGIEFTANVKPNFPTPSLWRGIRMFKKDSNGNMTTCKSYTYDCFALG